VAAAAVVVVVVIYRLHLVCDFSIEWLR